MSLTWSVVTVAFYYGGPLLRAIDSIRNIAQAIAPQGTPMPADILAAGTIGLAIGVVITAAVFIFIIMRAGREMNPPAEKDSSRPPVEDAGHVMHDYRDREYRVLKVFKGGDYIHVTGRGYGVEVGHYVILNNGSDGETCYRMTSVVYAEQPGDFWMGEADFEPRPTLIEDDDEIPHTH